MAGANEVSLPIDAILRSLEKFADLEMYGTIELELSLLPEAATSVRITAAYDHHSLPEAKPNPFRPEVRDKNHERAERLAGLRSVLNSHRHKFRIICPVTKIRVAFDDGKCKSVHVVEREELGIGAR